jgi:hypothetical protein
VRINQKRLRIGLTTVEMIAGCETIGVSGDGLSIWADVLVPDEKAETIGGEGVMPKTVLHTYLVVPANEHFARHGTYIGKRLAGRRMLYVFEEIR